MIGGNSLDENINRSSSGHSVIKLYHNQNNLKFLVWTNWSLLLLGFDKLINNL